jgi:serine/threonine protein kinase
MMLLLLNELDRFHKENILHRDIKADNIMVYERESKYYYCFIDFGSSYHLELGIKKFNI